MALPKFLSSKKEKSQTKTPGVKQPGNLYEAPSLNVVEENAGKEKKLDPGDIIKEYEEKPKIGDPNIELYQKNLNLLDVIAPQSIEVDFNYIKINKTFFRTVFVAGYPRFVAPGWLEPVINFNSSLDTSFYIYPVEGKSVLDDLRRKIAEMEAEISTDLERGKIVDPSTQAKLEDARSLQEQLVKGAERFFEFSFYVTIPASTLEELNDITRQVESTLGSLLIVSNMATLDMENGFLSTTPFGIDKLAITRNMDTTSLATTFPLTSAELSSDKGVLYGINSQNESFIIFDRFSLENANMTVFATSGAGKSVHFNTPVLYRNQNGKINFEKIGKVVDNLFKERGAQKLDSESDGVVKPGIEVFGFNGGLNAEWSKVSVAARKKSPKVLFKITTKSGREVTATGDHNFVVLKKGNIYATRGKTIKEGDYIPLPKHVSHENQNTDTQLNVEGVINNEKFPIKKYGKRLCYKRISRSCNVPQTIKVSGQFFELLGYFASEGMVTTTKSLISTTSKDVLKSVSNYYKSIGLAHSYVRKGKIVCGIYVSSQVFAKFLTKLGVSGNAQRKRVPQIVFSATDNQLACFLKAYFEGDGGVESHHISATTKSKGLASDMTYLLYRFGVIARIHKTKKAASNTKDKVKRTYYKISISGQDNIRKFITKIGFVSKNKNQKAKKLLKKGNTNVDVIPEMGPVFKEIYKVLYFSSEIPAPKNFSEIKLETFKPSAKELQKIILEIEKRVKEIENLEHDGMSTLKKLPTIKEIVDAGIPKNKNKLLWKKLNQSWRTMKIGVPPKLSNAIKAAHITHDYTFSQMDVSGAIYRTFQKTGESLKGFDSSLWDAIINQGQNPLYQKVIKARDYISEKYEVKRTKLIKVKQKLAWLNVLAHSDLFWDPIVKIEKTKSNMNYVYDLQVENGVFLAGHGGMFVHNSYFVKLESLRSLMLGTEVVVIDPESEYQSLAEAVGGEFISFSFSSPSKINPFDLSQIYSEGENQLGLKILTLHSFFKVIMGTLTPIQEALLDRALVATYRAKRITQDPQTQKNEPPLMEDLYKTLIGMETVDALDLAARIEKFVKGGFVGIFDQQTNISIDNPFTVFSVKDMQEALRPIAMFMILDFIWTRIQRDLKRRLLIVDEAWHMMRYEDSAQFLWSVVKRARKYFLGLTTITQDVEDFLAQDIGKAIVTNSALRLLLKQSPAAIDKIGEIFYLSQGEKQLLLAANIGEGIFFAGPHHAPIRVVGSQEEHKLITTKPQEKLGYFPKKERQQPSPNIPINKEGLQNMKQDGK